MKKGRGKNIVLMIAGPGVLLIEAILLFVHLFTSNNLKPWIIAGLVIFFLVFIPLYSFEYFTQEFKRGEKGIRFGNRRKRSTWQGGNIHGSLPKNEDRPGRIFKS